MREASSKKVAAHFGLCAAFSLSAIAAPFVPESVLAYAGIRYLFGFVYGARQWQSRARVPLHLGKRGYRDATSRKRGAATWPIGVTDGQQVWLEHQDLAHGCAFLGDDPTWQAEIVERLALGACLNQMGAILVQPHDVPLLADTIAALAQPFGRDTELASIDLGDPLAPPLRITTRAIAAALADSGLPENAMKLHEVIAPIFETIATRDRISDLSFYRALVHKDALDSFISGHFERTGEIGEADAMTSTDELAREQAVAALKAIPERARERGCELLAPYAHELAAAPGLSLVADYEISKAIASRRLTCIRPSSPFTAALAAALCADALAELGPELAKSTHIHVGFLHHCSGATADRFFAAAKHAGAVSSIALPYAKDPALLGIVRDACGLEFEFRPMDESSESAPQVRVHSKLKDCRFAGEVQLFAVPA